MRSNSIGNALFTKTQQKVLGLLFGKPDQSFYLNEIVHLSQIGRGTIKRELERLESSGIVVKQRIGNQNHYQANSACPIFQELLGLIRKTFGVADVIKSALDPILGEVVLGFIYGSVAKGEDTAKSDIDLLIVSNVLTYSEVMERLLEAETSLARPVNPSIYNVEQIEKKLEQDNVFVSRVMEQPKIWIKEDEDVYRTFRQSS